jgi:sulfite reductase (NADPH) hemoprotein beta-component
MVVIGDAVAGASFENSTPIAAEFDHAFVAARVIQFRDQVARRLSGEISEDEFKPLRLMNGALSAAARLHAARRHPLWHAQRRQMRKLAHDRRRL